MERMTMRDARGMAFCVELRKPGGVRLTADKDDTRRLDRLAAYEDTGLEPEEITTEPYGCVFYCNRKCNLDGDFCAEGPGCPWEIDAETAKHMLELAKAEKGGRLVVLPCKVGQEVWFCNQSFNGEIYPATVISIEFNYYTPSNPIWIMIEYMANRIRKQEFRGMWDLMIGKIVFLTREEAEAALKKEEEST